MSNIIEVARSSGRTNRLIEAVRAAGLDQTLVGAGPYTLFAPTDEAFEAIPQGELDRLLGEPEMLKRVLLYHVVSGRLSAKDLVRDQKVTSLEGADLVITPREGTVMVNAARVVEADIAADNGVVHLVDLVIAPQTVTT